MKPWRPSSANALIPKLPSRSAVMVSQSSTNGLQSARIEDRPASISSQNYPASSNPAENILDIPQSDISKLNKIGPSRAGGFESVLLRFSSMILVEGRKAVEEATSVANESYKADIKRMSDIHNEALVEKDLCIRELTNNTEDLRQRVKTLKKQLMNMSVQMSRRSHFPFTSAQVFQVWYTKAAVDSSPRIYHVFHRSRLLTRILFRWHVGCLNDSWKRKRDAALRTQADRHKSAVQSFHNQQESLKSELSHMQQQLQQEVAKRESFQLQLKRFIEGGFDNNPQTARIPNTSPSLVSRACTLTSRAHRRANSCTPNSRL